jgi:hypothetical protein
MVDLCQHISEGGSLGKFCKAHKVSAGKVIAWIAADETRGKRYVRAREASADLYAEEIVELSDKATSKNYNAIRLQVDARKWAAAKLKPQRYGDRLDLNHSGQIDTRTIPDDRLDARITELLGKTGTTLAPGGAAAASLPAPVVDLLPGDGATSAGFVSEAHGVLRRGEAAPGETDAGG